MSHATCLKPLRVDTPQPISPSCGSAIDALAPSAPLPAPVTLFADLFTLLCVLRQQDIKAKGQRFLTPSALSAINQQLLRPEPCPNMRWRKERDTTHLRLLHFLAEAAGLVAPIANHIKPTPAAYDWLQLPPHQQRDQLLNRICTQPTSLALWHIYQWPGWQLIQNGVSLAELFAQLQPRPGQTWLSLSTVCKLIPVQVLRNHPDAQPAALLRGFAQILDALGLIDWRFSTHIRLRQHPRPPIPLHLNLQLPQEAQPRQLTGATDQRLPALYAISEYCAISADPVQACLPNPIAQLCLTLDPARCQRALAHGVPARAIQHHIETALGKRLPHAFIRQLHAQQRQTQHLTLSRVLLLESTDPNLITNLAQQRGIKQCIDRTLSPRAVTVPDDQLPTLLRRLAWRDLTPAIQSTVALSALAPPNPAAAKSFDQPTLAHLYLSARLCHVLPDVLPIPYRLPFAVLADLEKQLSRHDRALVQVTLDRCLADLARAQPRPTDEDDASSADDDDWPIATPAHAQHLARIEHALANSAALALTYYSPQHDGLTQRTIEPLRIEQSGPCTYLIAYCHLAQAQRTFRLDRIRALQELEIKK